jgi:organic radical activating enzyme
MKHQLDRVEFYITNVCNFNCTDCNRYSNYRFAGHQLWNDYSEVYKHWSQRLDLDVITVLGGEPLLNPSLDEWLKNLRDLWPDSDLRLVTNGTRLSYWPNLYQLLKDLSITLEVTAHNQLRHSELLSQLKALMDNTVVCTQVGNLENWTEAYKAVSDPSWPACYSIEDFYNLPEYIQQECRTIHRIDPEIYKKNTSHLELVDANNVIILLYHADAFETAPLRYSGNNQFNVYQSDPASAHEVCPIKFCHNFVRGKLYKCPQMALLPEFRKQYHVNMTAQELSLLDNYQPLLPTDSDDQFSNFLNSIGQPIAQCSLCPSNIEINSINSSTKKLKVKKIPIRPIT